jgi:hypothetical protein
METRVNVSRYIRPFDSLRPGEIVELWIPVSNPERSKAEAEEAEVWLRLAVENGGASVGPRQRRSLDRVTSSSSFRTMSWVREPSG